MTSDDLITLNEEIAGMARAGLPLDQGMSALAREMGRGRLQRVTARIADDLRAGRTLPEALQRQTGRVPPYYAHLVAAGVRSGRISEVLATLTAYARSMADFRTTLESALLYPAVVLFLAFGLFGGAAAFILPQFDQIYRDFNLAVPLVTQWVLALGRHPLEFVVLPVVVLLVQIFVLWVLIRSLLWVRLLWTRLVYALPVVGTLLRSTRMAAFTELLSILVDHDVPLPEAFRLAGEASSDPLLAAASPYIEQELREGVLLAGVLRRHGLVPELVAWVTGLGERQGTLAKALHQVASIYRRQAEMRAALMKNVLPPFMILFAAGMAVTLFGVTVVAPMYKLIDGLSKM